MHFDISSIQPPIRSAFHFVGHNLTVTDDSVGLFEVSLKKQDCFLLATGWLIGLMGLKCRRKDMFRHSSASILKGFLLTLTCREEATVEVLYCLLGFNLFGLHAFCALRSNEGDRLAFFQALEPI